MVLTYNNFKKVVEHSAEKMFNKLAEAVATSDNAALVSMYDDKLMILDEEHDELFLCNYLYENGVLTMRNFEKVTLTENDENYLDEVVADYFDVDSEKKVTVEDLMTGFSLKFKNDSHSIFTEAKDRKYRKIQESSRIRAIKRAREARNMFEEEIKSLLEEPFLQHISMKVDQAKDSVPAALNKVTFKPTYGDIKVNTDIGGPAKELITLKDNTNVMDAMKKVAVKVSQKWTSDAFRGKFEKMINKILASESMELGKDAMLSFLDENKELYLLKRDLFEELITKTALMYGETDTEELVEAFEKVMKTKEGRAMKNDFLKRNGLNEEKIAEINALVEQGEDELDTDISMDDEPSKEATSSVESEDVKKIVDILKKIGKQLEDDSPEAEYVGGLVSSLEGLDIEDSKMKEVIDFLSSVETPKEDEEEEDDEEDDDEGVEL